MCERGLSAYLIIQFLMFFDTLQSITSSRAHNKSRGHERMTYTGLGGEGSGRADKSKGKSELHG
jgi:hypothetical protein